MTTEPKRNVLLIRREISFTLISVFRSLATSSGRMGFADVAALLERKASALPPDHPEYGAAHELLDLWLSTEALWDCYLDMVEKEKAEERKRLS